MFTSRPIGFVSSPYKDTSQVPRGLGAKHDAEGVLKILPEFEAGLADIEGFSHLYVIWEFDRSKDYDLIAHPPADDGRPRLCVPICIGTPRSGGQVMHLILERNCSSIYGLKVVCG